MYCVFVSVSIIVKVCERQPLSTSAKLNNLGILQCNTTFGLPEGENNKQLQSGITRHTNIELSPLCAVIRT